MLLPALRHRIILNFEAHADGRTPDDLLEEIVGESPPELNVAVCGWDGDIPARLTNSKCVARIGLTDGCTTFT